jgi:hypothetical protein
MDIHDETKHGIELANCAVTRPMLNENSGRDSVHENFAVSSSAASILLAHSSPTSAVSNNAWWWSSTEVNMPSKRKRTRDGGSTDTARLPGVTVLG